MLEFKFALGLTLKLKFTVIAIVICVKPADILAQLQTFITLEEGDIVMTGTPKGVGVINTSANFTGQVQLAAQDNSIKNNSLLTCQWLAK